jgi:hypothetical protein
MYPEKQMSKEFAFFGLLFEMYGRNCNLDRKLSSDIKKNGILFT